MDERTLRILEFPKIRDRLAALTVTATGRERAATLMPQTAPDAVRRALAETSEAAALLAGGEVPLRGTSDIREALRSAQVGSALTAAEFLALRDTLSAIRLCKGSVWPRRDHAPLLAAVAQEMQVFQALEDAVRRTVGDDGSILDGASADLAQLRREQQAAHARIQEKLDDLVRGPFARMLQEALVTSRADRYVVPVRQEFKNQFPGVLHDQSASGATVFMEPLATLQLGNHLRELEIAEREEVLRILRALTAEVAAAAEPIGRSYDALGRIDLAVAKALLAERMGAAAPAIRTDGVLRLTGARHPLLTGDVVPIDVRLGDEFTTLVITGPNTGGKTVTLKTIGLLTLMAQAGLHIPAAPDSEAATFAQVFADIGDEQSIEQSLSTFSSHMSAIVGILNQLDPGPSPPGGEGRVRGTVSALVLLDEIGAGTDPTEGVALARALIEHLRSRGVRTVVTTHYNELKALAYGHEGIQNASVEFDPRTLQPTFRLLIGVPGRSNALTIAARLGLPPAIVEQAQSLLGPEVVAIDRVLSDIESDRRAYEWELAEASRLRTEANALRTRSDQELARLRDERKKALMRLREEADALLVRARNEVEGIVTSLKTAAGSRDVQEARSRLRQLAEELAASAEPPLPEGQPLTGAQPGQAVFIVPLNRSGTVIAAPDARGEVEVEAGAMRVKVHLGALRAVTGQSADKKIPPLPLGERVGVRGTGMPSPVPLSLSLRGLTVDEAIPKLDRYLDDAFVAGLTRVTIVHGKGTGALRKAVHDFLKTHPHVRHYRLGEKGEGDTGSTIVDLNTQ